MGVGTPVDIAEAVMRGIDMFDCVIPTRHARNGQLFTSRGNVKFRHANTGLTRRRQTRTAIAIPAATTRWPICGTW